TVSLHDALPILRVGVRVRLTRRGRHQPAHDQPPPQETRRRRTLDPRPARQVGTLLSRARDVRRPTPLPRLGLRPPGAVAVSPVGNPAGVATRTTQLQPAKV